MNLNIFEFEEELDIAAANDVVKVINENPNAALGLATGETPIGLYQKLVQAYENEQVSFKRVTTYNIDEYAGLGKAHPQSFYSFMKTHLFAKVDLPEGQIHIPNGAALDLEGEVERYEALLKQAGQLDVQILSIGLNGHIGFNEPGRTLHAETHVVPLTEETRQVNSKSFPSLPDVPKQAITMGIGTMIKAKKIVFIAKGEAKAAILKQAFKGPINPLVPGSLLQLHPNLEVYLDVKAAKFLYEG
ncbi:glucosamine-6-phosphate deaminase [Bacillus canaveralius]|uniref:glucosamine-6-phosphate deaminase n=1 Tax=Bacillus canaveralius TaxID=1403243 RepID=UPI000F7AE9DB|nr:glucosamine-6-phosphate deaminase [Bacillus canaveralius]RSK53258.1 glucosamine-6-phosphate deaminase [Bacillus canaveralius]